MWRISAVSILAAIMGVAVLSMQTAPVHACTPPGPDFDAYASSSLILEGRITGWGVLEQFRGEEIAPIGLEMDVTRVWKGVGGRSIDIVDDASYWAYGEAVWGPGGSCGFFHEDPTGSYVIMGLRERRDGIYAVGAFSLYFLGDESQGADYDAAISLLTARQANIILPSTGASPMPSPSPNHLIAAVVALGAALLAASFAIRYGAATRT